MAPLGILLPLFLPALGHLPPGLRTWSSLLGGAFAAECLAATAVTALAFGEVIPGQAARRWNGILTVTAAAAVPAGFALLAALVVPSRLPDRAWGLLTVHCFLTSVATASPVLGVLLALAWRGLVWRPARIGGLLGLAAGLLADAGKRGFCTVSQPSHVVLGHLAAIGTSVVIGVAAGKACQALARARAHAMSQSFRMRMP